MFGALGEEVARGDGGGVAGGLGRWQEEACAPCEARPRASPLD